MLGSGTTLHVLLNRPKTPNQKWVTAINILSWVLPAGAALLAVIGGLAAIKGANELAAILSIVGGISSAAGVIFTGWASRIRDGRLAVARALGELGISMAEHTQRQMPPNGSW